MEYLSNYFRSVREVTEKIDLDLILEYVNILNLTRINRGRVFVLGMGGSAANASHMVNDLRKICGLEAYAPTDNTAEFSASCNDEGLGSYFPRWLTTSNVSSNDVIFVLSVGGGSKKNNVSMELVNAIEISKKMGAKILGIVGRDGGEAARNSKEVLIVPTINSNLDTPLVESFQALVWHAIVFHPKLKIKKSKWESIDKQY